MSNCDGAPPYMDKASPEAWKVTGAFAATVSEPAPRLGLDPVGVELLNLRVKVHRVLVRHTSQDQETPG